MKPADFNSYGSRRGNHEVMVRGTFANVRLRNKMVPSLEGGFTRHLPDGAEMSIFDASEKYIAEGVPLVILAGKEYGSGSSRDWAAKGPRLLGVRAVIAESYERIHRSNLVGMGILPLQFLAGESAQSLGPDRRRDLRDLRASAIWSESSPPGRQVKVARRSQKRVQSAGAHRYAAGGAILRQWRDFAVCAEAVAGEELGAFGSQFFDFGCPISRGVCEKWGFLWVKKKSPRLA